MAKDLTREDLDRAIAIAENDGYLACSDSEIHSCKPAIMSYGVSCFRWHVDCRHHPNYIGDEEARRSWLATSDGITIALVSGGLA